jgi:predicted alpha/beta hydrolase
MKPTSSEPEHLTLRTADGYPLVALRYPATVPLRGHLVMAGATGVPQLFYRNFALYAASQGYTTLTLDYRGIGLSKPATLRGFRMRYLQWARDDLSAAVDAMASDAVPLLMWRIVGPMLTRWRGYLAWSKLGMGEDLPLGVFREWKHWCRYPRYFFDDPTMGVQVQDLFDNVTTPIIAANATDDLWAPPASRDAFMSGYRYTDLQAVDIVPADRGLGAIGHMGYFRRAAQPLWEDALHWFGEHPQPRPAARPQQAATPTLVAA